MRAHRDQQGIISRIRNSENLLLLLILFLISGIGMAMLFSAAPSAVSGIKAVFFWGSAFIVFLVCALTPLRLIRRAIPIITILGLLLLVAPFVLNLGSKLNGATRWINLGFTTIQPSEFWKPISILYLAHTLEIRKDTMVENFKVLLPPMLIIALGCMIIILQNNLSTVIIAVIIGLTMFLIGGAPSGLLAATTVTGLITATLLVLTSSFRMKRFMTFIAPDFDRFGQSFQVASSIKAISSGGFWGKGIGLGTLKIKSIPAVQNDFIFAAISEEVGLFGVTIFFMLWAFLAAITFKNAFQESDNFRSYLGFGLTVLLLVEMLINVAVAAGAIPATGSALPFFSAGGSSLLASSGIAGLLVNLGRKEKVEGASYA